MFSSCPDPQPFVPPVNWKKIVKCCFQNIIAYRVPEEASFQTLGSQSFRRLPRWLSGKEPACQYKKRKRCAFYPWVGKIPWRRAGQPTQQSLSGYIYGVAKSQTQWDNWACMHACRALEKICDNRREFSHLCPSSVLLQGSGKQDRLPHLPSCLAPCPPHSSPASALFSGFFHNHRKAATTVGTSS